MTFTTHCHTFFQGSSNGRSTRATFKPSTRHMLSYATIVLDITVKSSSGAIPSSNNGLNFRYSQRTNIKKACEGDSDLKRKGNFSTYDLLCRTVLYIHIYYQSRLNKKASTQGRHHQSNWCPPIKRRICVVCLVQQHYQQLKK